jgi:hypothetical protein
VILRPGFHRGHGQIRRHRESGGWTAVEYRITVDEDGRLQGHAEETKPDFSVALFGQWVLRLQDGRELGILFVGDHPGDFAHSGTVPEAED